MSPDFSVRASRSEIDETIQLGYQRAQENFGEALALAQNTPWLWGEHASFEDYANVNPVTHQLSGELPLSTPSYRTEEYTRCTDSVSKELSSTFQQDVHERGVNYLAMALDPELTLEQRLITLDFAKQYALTMFHAVQYPMRTKHIDRATLATVDQLATAARAATRAFYLDVLGHDSAAIAEETTRAKMALEAPDAVTAVATADSAHFKSQEMDQPLTILASSLLATEHYPTTELIYGLPAGGTQHAIVTQLLFELRNGSATMPELEYLPISTHSTNKSALHGKISDSVSLALARNNPRGKDVLVCEDNTNTGTTLSLTADVINASSPNSLHISIVEFDPRRLAVKYRHPNPSAQIANYEHPDFTTAVGIVPVTIGEYPDIQMRKLYALRRLASQGIRSEIAKPTPQSYEQIPADFYTDFVRIYKDTLRYCGDTYGYRSPHIVSAAMLRQYAERGLVSLDDDEHTAKAVLAIARAATLYPHLPNEARAALRSGAESLDYRPDGPWMRQGAQALIRELLDYSEAANSSVTIWTKGDGATTANPPHVGLNEQTTRYQLSGLRESLHGIGFQDSSRGSFAAHPKKTHLLKTRVLPDILQANAHIKDIVIIDDSEKNLAEAAQFIRLFGLRPHVINPLDPATERTKLDDIRQLAQQRAWGDNVAFIVDMDDTLLHEGFRKYHQPRNMALSLLTQYPELANDH